MNILLENLHDTIMSVVADDMDTALKTVALIGFSIKYVPELGSPEQQIKAAKECLERLKKKDRIQETYKQFKNRHIHPQTEHLHKEFLAAAEAMLELHYAILCTAINEIKKPLNNLIKEYNGILEA